MLYSGKALVNMKRIIWVYKRYKATKKHLAVTAFWLLLILFVQFLIFHIYENVNGNSAINRKQLVEYTYVPQRNNTEDLSRIADYPSSFTVPESIVLFGRGNLDGTGRSIDVISYIPVNYDSRALDAGNIVVSYDIYDALRSADYEDMNILLNGMNYELIGREGICINGLEYLSNTVVIGFEDFINSFSADSIHFFFKNELSEIEQRQLDAWMRTVFSYESIMSNADESAAKTVLEFFSFSVIVIVMLLVICESVLIISYFRSADYEYGIMRYLGASVKDVCLQKMLYMGCFFAGCCIVIILLSVGMDLFQSLPVNVRRLKAVFALNTSAAVISVVKCIGIRKRELHEAV